MVGALAATAMSLRWNDDRLTALEINTADERRATPIVLIIAHTSSATRSRRGAIPRIAIAPMIGRHACLGVGQVALRNLFFFS